MKSLKTTYSKKWSLFCILKVTEIALEFWKVFGFQEQFMLYISNGYNKQKKNHLLEYFAQA